MHIYIYIIKLLGIHSIRHIIKKIIKYKYTILKSIIHLHFVQNLKVKIGYFYNIINQNLQVTLKA